MARGSRLENVFSWSKSRDSQFRECQRRYYFDKYASWGGWSATAPKEARLAYMLKNLKNRWMWKGETVHHVIEEILKSLRNGFQVTLDSALKDLTETMRRDYRSSKMKKYLEDPKRHLGLFEHEYAKPVSDAVWKKVHDEAAACLRNFLSSALFRELEIDEKKNWLAIEDLEEFDFEGSKIFVKLDFARRKNGLIEIYDWKTGKNDAEAASVQIGAYAIYAMGKWGVKLDEIRAYLFNVAGEDPKPEPQPLTEGLIRETREAIAGSIRMMRELLDDPEKNVPKARESFKFTEDERLCNMCNFLKICEKHAPTAPRTPF